MSLEAGSGLSIKDKLRRLAKPFQGSPRPQPSKEELLKGIGALEDPRTYRVLGHTVQNLSVSGWEIFIKEPLVGEQTGQEVLDDVKVRLGTLTENGFLNRTDTGMGDDLALYSPTAKGVRVFSSLRRI